MKDNPTFNKEDLIVTIPHKYNLEGICKEFYRNNFTTDEQAETLLKFNIKANKLTPDTDPRILNGCNTERDFLLIIMATHDGEVRKSGAGPTNSIGTFNVVFRIYKSEQFETVEKAKEFAKIAFPAKFGFTVEFLE